jgi:hypothetical protein
MINFFAANTASEIKDLSKSVFWEMPQITNLVLGLSLWVSVKQVDIIAQNGIMAASILIN